MTTPQHDDHCWFRSHGQPWRIVAVAAPRLFHVADPAGHLAALDLRGLDVATYTRKAADLLRFAWPDGDAP